MSVTLEELTRAIEEARKLAKPRRFAQSYELIVKLRDVDVKRPENRFVQLIPLPNPPPKKLSKVAVIAGGDMALRARDAGADAVLTREDVEKLAASKRDAKKLVKSYDVFLAQADMMPIVGRLLGRFMGPLGKMPQPVPPTANIAPFIERARRSVRIRLRDQPQVMCRIGTEDQDPREVAENAMAVINFLLTRFKPHNIEKVYVKLTMGPSVRVK